MVNGEFIIVNGESVASFTIINSPFTIRKHPHTEKDGYFLGMALRTRPRYQQRTSNGSTSQRHTSSYPV